MADEDPYAPAAWLEETQGVRLAPERLREAVKVARRLGAMADAADSALPFGAEPSGFAPAQSRLATKGERG
jgi:hypothetical protein